MQQATGDAAEVGTLDRSEPGEVRELQQHKLRRGSPAAARASGIYPLLLYAPAVVNDRHAGGQEVYGQHRGGFSLKGSFRSRFARAFASKITCTWMHQRTWRAQRATKRSISSSTACCRSSLLLIVAAWVEQGTHVDSGRVQLGENMVFSIARSSEGASCAVRSWGKVPHQLFGDLCSYSIDCGVFKSSLKLCEQHKASAAWQGV